MNDPAGVLDQARILHEAGKLDEAVALYSTVLQMHPSHPDALRMLGLVHLMSGRPQSAADLIERALAVDPGYAEALADMGVALKALDRFDEAVSFYRKALALKPQVAETHNNLGNALLALQRFDESVSSYERALALNPAYALAHSNLGAALNEMQRYDEALQHFERALALEPAMAHAAYNRSLLLLRSGNFREGWPLYEKRWQARAVLERPHFGRPTWLGNAPIAGRHLLIQHEQGLGDTIEMLRYIPQLEAMGAQVWVEAPPALTALVGRSFPRARTVALGECPAAADYRIPVMSLPFAMGTFSEADIPRPIPYLVPDESRQACWSARLAGASGVKRSVGLAWRGNPKYKYDSMRSAKLADFAPLFAHRDTLFVALHDDLSDEETEELLRYPNAMPMGAGHDSFDDLAALVSVLEVVISVESAPAQLAGAVGGTPWVIVSSGMGWFWQAARSDSPWYPKARVFRQTSPRDWPGVVAAVDAALSSL